MMMKERAVENKVQRYESYKDSGVEWLGEIPEHWECIRMKRLYADVSIKNRPNELLSSVTQDRGVIPRDWIESRMVMPSGNLDSFKFIEKEDFAISLRSFEGGLEYCFHDGIISPAYTVLKKKKEDLFPLFYKYLFKSVSFISELQTSVVGIREGKNISYSELSYSFLPIPPLQEQTAIAQFLDDKTTKINEAIVIKEQQIKLLKERKQILIHKAVTQGLNPNVKFKKSGIEWVGEVPEHWEVKNFRYAFKFLNYKRIPLSGIEREKMQGIYPYYGASGIIDYVDDYIFDEKLILIAEDGANLLSKSTPLAFVAEGKYWVNNHAHIIRPLLNGFSYWAEQLSLIDYTVFISGSAQPKLSRNNLGSVKVIVPSLQDIKEISDYIETTTDKIDTAISLKQQEIEKLKEYKSSLINSVVTGKVKVC